jgi:L-2-hydroxyglutarate oxidase LhgO
VQRQAVVIGAGIVGLATARAIRRADPSVTVVILEKERGIARHQSGRNSGVIHAGVYYRPGSDKARLCSSGRLAMLAYCREHGIAHQVCGKLVVAVTQDEVARLRDLRDRCRANGVDVEELGPSGLRDLEPHATGLAALHVPATGIVSYAAVSEALAAELRADGVEIRTGVSVIGGHDARDGLVIETDGEPVPAELAVNCGGLQADRIARAMGATGLDGVRIVPFRGEYFELVSERAHLVRGLIYPVPDPHLPFLGVHLTRGIDGHVHVGPNAVLAMAREGYSWRAVSGADLMETARFAGFRRLAAAQWRSGVHEVVRSLSRRSFTRTVQRLVPDVQRSDLRRARAGVRAQAVLADGTLADDFLFHRDGRVLHVINAPSPAATASLEIGRIIAGTLLGHGWGPSRSGG